jgi:hypothetical protein
VEPVVLVANRRRLGAAKGRLKYVLYPVFAYRVIAPKAVARELNILQRAVLGLCRAGVVRAGEIGGLLKIHEDLAAKVLQSLQGRRLLDTNGRITERGQAALQTNLAAGEEQPIAGYVFQDPWTRRVWPRFVERLAYADVAPREDGFADLLLGTAGEPRQERAYTLWPREQFAVAPPGAAEVLQVVRRHGRLRADDTDRADAEDALAGGTQLGDAPRLERLTHIESEPRPVYLATAVYAPEVPIDGALWEVADPFGGGRSAVARECIANRRSSDQGLESLLNGLVAAAQTDASIGLGEVLEQLELAAALHVEERLGRVLRGTALFSLAIAMERAKREAEVAGERCPPDKLDDVLLKVQKVVEQLLGDVQQRHAARRLWQMLDANSRSTNALLLNKCAHAMGFTTPLPESLTSVRQGKVQWAADNGQGSLRPRLIAAILAAYHKLLHPLRAAGQARPELLRELDRLASFRDKSGHAIANGAGIPPLSVVVEQTEIAYATISLLATDPVLPVTPATIGALKGVALR